MCRSGIEQATAADRAADGACRVDQRKRANACKEIGFMNALATARLLIVDDEAALMTALCKTLELEGYVTTGFTSAREALKQLAEREFDILLTDLMMPEMDGIALLRDR